MEASGNVFAQTAVIANAAVLTSANGQAILSGATGSQIQYVQSGNSSVIAVNAQTATIQVSDGITQAEIAVYPANVTVSNGAGGDTEFIVIGNITGGNLQHWAI